MLVAAGIFLSRCSGLVRESVIANYLGTSPASDAFRAALRIPNLLQNLLGEGVLSASFIPVYARLRAEGREQEAGHVAGAVAGLLVALTGVLSLVGVVLAEPLTRVLVPGFHDTYRFDLTVQLVRIIFPGIGFLVLSAWCLGVLNSHRKFFLSYVAPVLWNAAQIAALVAVGLTTTDTRTLAYAVSWGVLIGGILQFGVQIGPVRRLLGGVHLSLDTANESVRSVLARFGPVVMGRGVVQIMGYVDLLLASYLATGSVASLQYALVLYLLPISLFGMSVAAAELPELSEVEVHDAETRRRFRLRLEEGMARIAWYVAPTATLFIVVGDVIVRAVFQRGNFTSADTIVVWLTLAVFSLSLPATTSSRLLQNGLYALDDARTPARVAAMSVVLAAIIGLAFMFPLDRLVVGPDGIEGWSDVFAFGPLPEGARNAADVAHLGIVGLAIGAAVSRLVRVPAAQPRPGLADRPHAPGRALAQPDRRRLRRRCGRRRRVRGTVRGVAVASGAGARGRPGRAGVRGGHPPPGRARGHDHAPPGGRTGRTRPAAETRAPARPLAMGVGRSPTGDIDRLPGPGPVAGGLTCWSCSKCSGDGGAT